jgi:DNA ligase (NAD+)
LLFKRGVSPAQPQKSQYKSHPFYGKTFVLTGSLHSMSRSEASTLIKERGGKVSNSVSSQTDYLVVGEDPGSKFDKAKKLNVSLLTEAQFKEMI